MSNAIREAKSIISATAASEQFELAQRKAKLYASSTLVPKEYQGNIANVYIAMEMAHRLGVNELQAMQNINIIHGRPSFSAQFLISCFNSCGRFTAIKYRMSEDRKSCIAYATELSTGEIVEGTEVTMAMAEAEGWVSKSGSKWKTMPEHMLRWRAASFLVRQVAPEVGMGFHTTEELIDSIPTVAPVSTESVIARLTSPQTTPAASEDTDTYDDAIGSAVTTDEVYGILEEIDDDASLDKSTKEFLAAAAKERIAELVKA